MIMNWNERVSNDDEIYILGDLAFGNQEYIKSLISRLNGKKYLIKGNHDRHVDKNDIASNFIWIKDYYLLNHESGHKFVLFHYPIFRWAFQNYGSIHLYGHIHNLHAGDFLATTKSIYNVGADLNDYRPIKLREILQKLTYNGL